MWIWYWVWLWYYNWGYENAFKTKKAMVMVAGRDYYGFIYNTAFRILIKKSMNSNWWQRLWL